MKKLILLFLFACSVSINANSPSIMLRAPSKGIMQIGIKNPPVGQRFGIMVSYDLKIWKLAKDVHGNKCQRAFPSNAKIIPTVTSWHFLATKKQAFFRITK